MWWLLAGWLSIQHGILPEIANDVKFAASEDLWSWVGYIDGNDELDILHRNKKRATLIVHHENSDAKYHYVIVWSHGMHGFHDFKHNMYPQLRTLVKRGFSFTLIEPELPWSTYERSIDARRAWTTPGSFKRMVEAAMNKVPTMKKHLPQRIVVAGHSRGGKSIAYAATSGGLCDMNPHLILWSDATYGDWLKRAWKACLRSIPDRVEILYLSGTETQNAVRALESDIHFEMVTVRPFRSPWYHGKIGDNALILSILLGNN